MTSLWDPVDIYCERTDASLWSEPVNALSNIAFFIAAYLLYRVYRRRHIENPAHLGLIACLAVVGMGSLLFHTFGTQWSQLADVIPIVFFVVYYLFLCLRKLMGWSLIKTTYALAIFLLVASQMDGVPKAYSFNGSVAYFPCLAAIILIGLRLYALQHPATRSFFIAAALFVASLFFRSIDMSLCPFLPLGSHFLWHMLNGAMLYRLVKTLLDYAPARHK